MSIIPFNTETGEMLVEQGYTITSPEQRQASKKYFAREEARQLGRGEGFVFNVMDNVPHVSKKLTAAQCGYLLVLSTYINYQGALVTSERQGEPMQRADIMRVLGLRKTQKSTLSEFLDVCIENDIILVKDGEFFVNSDFHVKGSPQNPNVVRSIIGRLRDMAKVNKPEHVGFIYKIIPYISKYSNILCENPNEEIPSKRGKFNRKQLADRTGVAASYITRVTTTMVHRDKSVFAKVTTATDGTFYMLNPTIFRRADDVNYDDTTRDIFGID